MRQALPTLPPPAIALLAEAFPGTPIALLGPTVGGFSNLSLFARIGARNGVIKAAESATKRADLRREARLLTLLDGKRLGTPKLLAFAEGDHWSILVTARRRGRPGVRLYADPPEALTHPLGALGRSLARLHQLQLRPPDDAVAAGLLLAERATALATALRQLPLPAGLYEQLTTALAHPAWHCPTPRLVHGDAGLHNLLWAAPRLTLLDWELAGWGDPRVDLAWLAWTLRFRGLPPRCWQAVLAGYGPRAATLVADEATLRALALGQVSGLLARAAGRPHWDEWLRRARWSVELGPLF